jgi:hypothetical protein
MPDNQPLNIDLDLTNISTAVPVVANNTTAKVRLRNITQQDRDGTPIIRWEFALSEPAAAEDGTLVQAGHLIFVSFDTSQDWLKQKMARFVDGMLGTGDKGNTKGRPERPRFNAETVSQMLGKEALARITVTKSKKTDFVGNDVSGLTHLNDY